MKAQAERLVQFILENQDDYEKCIREVESFGIRQQINGIGRTISDNRTKFIDKNFPIIRLTEIQKPNDRKEYEPINPRIHGPFEEPEG